MCVCVRACVRACVYLCFVRAGLCVRVTMKIMCQRNGKNDKLKTPCVWTVTGLGMRAKAPAVGKRERGRLEIDLSLAVVQLSLGILDFSRYS